MDNLNGEEWGLIQMAFPDKEVGGKWKYWRIYVNVWGQGKEIDPSEIRPTRTSIPLLQKT